MSNCGDLKEKLESAPNEIMELLKSGPKLVSGLIDGLGYSAMNLALTQMIGDHGGEWDESHHQLALSDLVNDGEIQWRYDDELNVLYAMKSTWPVDETGENSPAMISIVAFLDCVVNLISDPMYDDEGEDSGYENIGWEAPFATVREVFLKGSEKGRSIWCDGNKVKITDYDFVVGAGDDSQDVEFDWPDCEHKESEVADALLKAAGL